MKFINNVNIDLIFIFMKFFWYKIYGDQVKGTNFFLWIHKTCDIYFPRLGTKICYDIECERKKKVQQILNGCTLKKKYTVSI